MRPARRTRRTLFLIHRWGGLGIAIFVLLQAATGVVNVFRHELLPVVHPQGMRAVPNGPRRPFGEVLLVVRGAFPRHHIERAVFPATPEDVYAFRPEPPDGGMLEVATVDPYSAAIRSSGSLLRYPVDAALYLHSNMLLGSTGQSLVGSLGLTLLALGVTGAILWWPGRRHLKRNLTIRAPRARLAFDLHQVPAICIVAIVSVMACTGAAIALRKKIEPLVALVAAVSAPPKLSLPAGPSGTPRPIESLFETAQSLFPGDPIRDVRFRGRASG